MGTRHVTELLSAAYDDALTPSERRRYDAHLATCNDCAAEAERFKQTIDAVHELPAARMPQRVVLPSTPPQPERRRGARMPEWLTRLPRPRATPAWSAGGLALTGILIVVLVVRGGAGGSSSNGTSALSDGTVGAAPGLAQTRGGAAQRATTGIGTCPLPLAVLPQLSSAPAAPPGFDNRATTGDQHRPGQQLLLATASTHVAPGAQVLIYAALTTSTSGRHSAVIPCVTLHQQGAVALAPVGGGSGSTSYGAAGGGPAASPVPCSPQPCAAAGAVQAPSAVIAAPNGTLLTPDQVSAFAPYALLPPLAVASPTATAVANLPLQVIRIPGDATPGTVLQLVALIPSGLPSSSDSPALEAVLTLDVS
ncbi:MAG TPA: zf-HC2 domain-containing protein [Candidatus Angelobacter sp.]|jgi:anti-sigma factor RsiW|nr:zf-HC2 domain-containing protein [Candidatus Angelobacter sp.]